MFKKYFFVALTVVFVMFVSSEIFAKGGGFSGGGRVGGFSSSRSVSAPVKSVAPSTSSAKPNSSYNSHNSSPSSAQAKPVESKSWFSWGKKDTAKPAAPQVANTAPAPAATKSTAVTPAPVVAGSAGGGSGLQTTNKDVIKKEELPTKNYNNYSYRSPSSSPSYAAPQQQSSGFSFGDAAMGYVIGNALFGSSSSHAQQPQIVNNYHGTDAPEKQPENKSVENSVAENKESAKTGKVEANGCTQKMKDAFECF